MRANLSMMLLALAWTNLGIHRGAANEQTLSAPKHTPLTKAASPYLLLHESFMDDEIARLLNENFVCIKEMDQFYMALPGMAS